MRVILLCGFVAAFVGCQSTGGRRYLQCGTSRLVRRSPCTSYDSCTGESFHDSCTTFPGCGPSALPENLVPQPFPAAPTSASANVQLSVEVHAVEETTVDEGASQSTVESAAWESTVHADLLRRREELEIQLDSVMADLSQVASAEQVMDEKLAANSSSAPLSSKDGVNGEIQNCDTPARSAGNLGLKPTLQDFGHSRVVPPSRQPTRHLQSGASYDQDSGIEMWPFRPGTSRTETLH